MLAERRTRSLRDLNAVMATATTQAEVTALALKTLSTFNFDLPFLLFYELEANGCYRLSGCQGLDPRSAAAPASIDPSRDSVWPLAAAVEGRGIVMIDGVAARIDAFDCGPYDERPDLAYLLPILVSDTGPPGTIVIAGVSSRLPLSDVYRGYYELLASALTAAVNTVRTREQERRRAEALAEIDRAKTAFFSNVSHEFRTPLTLMMGPLEDILSSGEELSTSVAGRIALVHRNGQRLLKLVNSLLDFSRIEAGRMQGNFEPTDITAFTAELASNFRSATERAGLRLIIEPHSFHDLIHVDRQMWEKVVLNLLSNAFKFTLAGEIRISWQHSADGRAVEMSVRDTGTGIPADELPRLFERFHRVEGARGRSFEGSGIGLALVLELVKLHGGTIHVSSTLGLGSNFTVSLPRGSSHLSMQKIRAGSAVVDQTRGDAFVNEALSWLAEADAPSSAETAGELPGKMITGRVLVADDNSDMRGYVVRLLRDAGLDVRAVSDGQAALEVARASAFDLILSDIMMPNLNGFELLKAVRSDPALRDVSVILLSARAGEEARVEGLDAGADDYLIKPFAARELVARVAGAIGLARGRRASQEAMRQVQKMEALGRLTGGVAHDFNNLMMVISGGLDLLAKQGDPGRRDRVMQGMRQATQRGASLTRQLLAFSRRQSLQPRPVNLHGFLQGAAEMLDRTLRGDVAVDLHVDADLWPVHVDPAGLELSLLNLCVNARDAMEKGGTIEIRAANASGGVQIEVIDHGKGMAEEIAAHAFEPFFTTKEIGAGSGLGLTQVYGFAHGSGGNVSIRSAPGKGTTVTLLLPRAAEGAQADVKTGPAVAVLRTTGAVLLVEDDEEVAALTGEMLQQLGFEVTRVASAASALGALANERKVDLVFSDVMMPGGMNGVELARELRRRRPGLPVLLTSGFAADARFEAAQDRMSILPKPFDLEELSVAIAEMMDSAA
jgi:signal transduction histidine kinase